jgi:hypothetical protein
LPGRGGGPLDHHGDLLERYGEHVVQHEREPFGRRERLQHHQQRQPDRVGEHRLLLGVAAVLRADDLVWCLRLEGVLAAPLAGAQRVEAHSSHHCGQPRTQVLHAVGVGAAEAQPGFLHGVVGVAHRAEHPVGHRS